MISGEEIKNLASLARIEVSEQETEKLQRDLGAILDYVGELKNANAGEMSLPAEALAEAGENYNNLREDKNALQSLEKGEWVKVKKIL